MTILGISSATNLISVAIVDDSGIIAETNVSGKDSFTEDIIKYIDKSASFKKEPITGISVVNGPGSYSGLRGSISTAKALAYSLNIPIVGVSTLETIAYNFIDETCTVAAITDARRDEYNFALFACNDNKIKRLTKDLLLSEEKILRIAKSFEEKIYFADSSSRLLNKFKGEKEIKVCWASKKKSLPYGANAAFIGRSIFKEGKSENFLKLSAKYSVEPNIREYKK